MYLVENNFWVLHHNLLCIFVDSYPKYFLVAIFYIRPKKKNCYVALTRPKFKNWVGRSGFFFFFTYRERVEFSNIFFKVSKWGKLGRNAVKTHIQVMQVLF